jgi:hypothetical protein
MNACLFRKRALAEHAAQALTQHNNERLVKLGAQMASTGKSEIMASVFAIASNDFMREHHDDETHQEPGNQPVDEAPAEEEDFGPKRRNRGNNRGKKKLFDLERVAKEKEAQLAEVARTLGADEHLARCKRIETCLKSKDENLCEKSGKVKNQKLMERIDENQAPNARQRKRGEDSPATTPIGTLPTWTIGTQGKCHPP